MDRSRVAMFAAQETREAEAGAEQPLAVSLVATCRNEAASVQAWLDSLLLQSRLPDEVVITDGGSGDSTLDLLQQRASTFPVPLIVLSAPGSNIARGRNLAIERARGPVIACTDLGCELDPDWLRCLVEPFASSTAFVLSAGYYEIIPSNSLNKLAVELFGVRLESVKPQDFLPSSRSVAFLKSLWQQAGGYPEWLSDAGEDTLFDYALKAQPGSWAFVPAARVRWRAPDRPGKLLRTYARYARGDGETGIAAPLYWYKTVEVALTYGRRGALLLAGLILSVIFGRWALLYWFAWLLIAGQRFFAENRAHARRLGVSFLPYTLVLDVLGVVQTISFARGVHSRGQVHTRQVQFYQQQLVHIVSRHPLRKGVIVYPPTHDWGFMFQRPHQMGRAFAHLGYLYFYCTANERTDAVFGFRKVEPNLFVCHVPPETFGILPRPVVYLGSAWNRSLLAHFDHPRLVYDHYDDLQVSGARPEDHLSLLETAEVVLVTAKKLQQAVHAQRPDALLIPNGVDEELIQRYRPNSEAAPLPGWPAAIQPGEPVIGYSGALAAWFDYPLLTFLARSRPSWRFVLVGVDYDGSLPTNGLLELPNVHWLGMQPYPEFFRYVWRFEAGIIPFQVNEITLATSPIKLFEYLACGLPVVSTALPECRGYEGVSIAENQSQFLQHVETALQAHRDPGYRQALNRVARQNTWQQRARLVAGRLEQGEKQAAAEDQTKMKAL